ncbi:MAG: NAD(P)-binding domain-containing protein [Tannerellaceae bacterium]|nr:NAD(P)-binding domain-containing protein [Tannerellaceae bacterium]
MKVTIIGAGNIGGAIARGLAQGSIVKAGDITCTDRSQAILDRLKEWNPEFGTSLDNGIAAHKADYIVLAVKPWMVQSVLEEIKSHIDYNRQVVVSVAAGVSFRELSEYLTKITTVGRSLPALFRVIPNTAIEARSSMTFVSACNASEEQTGLILQMFNELGTAMLVEERLMTAGTALASSGIAFALRYIRAAIEGGVELGFYPQEAQEIVVRTVKGAVDLLLTNRSNPEQEIDRVTTPGGITIRGLNEMELSGFTSAVIRGLKASK